MICILVTFLTPIKKTPSLRNVFLFLFFLKKKKNLKTPVFFFNEHQKKIPQNSRNIFWICIHNYTHCYLCIHIFYFHINIMVIFLFITFYLKKFFFFILYFSRHTAHGEKPQMKTLKWRKIASPDDYTKEVLDLVVPRPVKSKKEIIVLIFFFHLNIIYDFMFFIFIFS